jgi:cytidylate kinase
MSQPVLPPTVIAIDGPAGAGKSTVTRTVARRLGILFLDTGAMYRAATVGLARDGIAVDDAAAVAAWVCARVIDFDTQGRVRLDGVAISESELRSPTTTRGIWRVADNPACRAHLVAAQQAIIAGRDAALEGRDATTVIAPDATLKIYLDASPEERARRRLAEWSASAGTAPDFARCVAEIRERDARDMGRSVGALRRADDAVHLLTDGLEAEEVIARILAQVVRRRPTILERLLADQLLVGRSRAPGYVAVADGSPTGPGTWQLGLTNPSPDRFPHTTTAMARNREGRQAGVLCQGRAVMVLAGRSPVPDLPVAVPMLPQTWYIIEPGAWHAVVQTPGTICAWAEASGIVEERAELGPERLAVLRSWLAVYLPEDR